MKLRFLVCFVITVACNVLQMGIVLRQAYVIRQQETLIMEILLHKQSNTNKEAGYGNQNRPYQDIIDWPKRDSVLRWQARICPTEECDSIVHIGQSMENGRQWL